MSQNNIVCPYCDFHDEEWWEYLGPTDKNGSFSINCGDCGATLAVDFTMKIEVNFNTTLIEAPELDWQEEEKYFDEDAED